MNCIIHLWFWYLKSHPASDANPDLNEGHIKATIFRSLCRCKDYGKVAKVIMLASSPDERFKENKGEENPYNGRRLSPETGE